MHVTYTFCTTCFRSLNMYYNYCTEYTSTYTYIVIFAIVIYVIITSIISIITILDIITTFFVILIVYCNNL